MVVGLSGEATSTSLGHHQRPEDISTACNETGLDQVDDCSNWSQLHFVRSEEYWYDDGNIVLRTRTNPSEPHVQPVVHCFKCHKSLLSTVSEFFKTMFELPQASEGQATFEGVPCVDCPDELDDVKYMLEMAYSRGGKAKKWAPSVDPSGLFLGDMRVATKYEITKYIYSLTSQWETWWPNDFDDWSCRDSIYRENVRLYLTQIKNPKDRETWFDPVHTLLYAERFGVPKLLRGAWYAIGRSHASGSTPFGEQGPAFVDGLARRAANLDLLDDSHLHRLLTGRERLRDIATSSVLFLWNEICCQKQELVDSRGHDSCVETVEELFTEATGGEKILDAVQDPLGMFSRLLTDLRWEEVSRSSLSEDSCTCTHAWFEEKVEGVAKEIWGLLPQIFDFRLD